MNLDIYVSCYHCHEYLETKSEYIDRNDYNISVEPCKCGGGLVADLLAACEVLPDPRKITHKDWENGAVRDEFYIAWKKAQTAIAKAKGEQE